MRLWMFRVAGQVQIVRASDVADAKAVMRETYSQSDLQEAELSCVELDSHGKRGVVFNSLRR